MREAIEAAMLRGRQARHEGDLAFAEQSYAEAVKIAEEAGEDLLKAKALRHVSELNRDLGRVELAQTAGVEAVTIYRAKAESPPLDFANALRVTALAYQSAGKGPDARAAWSEARLLYADVGVSAGVAECDAHLNQA